MSLKKEIQEILHGKPTGEKDVMHGDCGQVLKSESIRSITDLKPVGLHPPPEVDLSDIDFDKIANSSEFKRFVYFIYTGKVHRGTREELDIALKVKKEQMEIIQEIGRGTHADFRNVINELKEVLKERREKSE